MRTPRSSAFHTGLALALASTSAAIALADGELDLGFSPPAELEGTYPRLTVIHNEAYVYGATLAVRRLHEDGSLDTGWQLAAPAGTPVIDVSGLPAGGLAVLTLNRLFLEYGDGTYVPASGKSTAGVISSPVLFPQEDSSVVVILPQTIAKFQKDGLVDPVFRIRPRLEAVNTVNATGPGSLSIGGTQDSQGRYVVYGNLHVSAPAERLALIRLLNDGSLDMNWNPAPALDLQLNADGRLNEQILRVKVLPDDSVLVVLENELAWINNQGIVTRRVPNLADTRGYFRSPIVQPDGKIILAGGFQKWGEVPASGLIRLHPDGSLDPSFKVQLDASGVDGMSLDTQGRLWIGGYFHTVNGVARPGVARVFAYTPDPTNSMAPLTAIITSQPHVAINEVLYLTTQVGGIPEPGLQWFRNGALLAGATNRGLRLNITNASDVGDFSLVASNALGTQTLTFPPISLAVRSPRPGVEDTAFNRALTNFIHIAHMVPLPDGRILVGSRNPYDNDTSETALVGRLLPDGRLDSSFGQEGAVRGRGQVATLVPLAGGGLLVTGDFTEFAGQPAQGLAELDRSGRLVARAFPSLDVLHVSAALPLPDGKLLIAGPFTKVGDAPAFRLARLNADLTLDTAFHSPLAVPSYVDALALDRHGRVLMAGQLTYGSGQTLTNPPSLGLGRLLGDGSADPAFHARTNVVGTIFVEEDGKLLVGMPPARLDEDGNVLTVFEDDRFPYAIFGHGVGDAFGPDHLMARTHDGGVIYQSWHNFANIPVELWRWKPTGERDDQFQSVFPPETVSRLSALAVLPDDSVLVNVLFFGTLDAPPAPEQARRLRRIAPDSDLSLRVKSVSAGQFHVALETQPGLTYEVYRREQLTGGTATKIGEYPGDGYVVDLQTPATGDATYLELRRH